MLKLFGKFIIGGRSGKREQAWAVFLLWCVAFGWASLRQLSGLQSQTWPQPTGLRRSILNQDGGRASDDVCFAIWLAASVQPHGPFDHSVRGPLGLARH